MAWVCEESDGRFAYVPDDLKNAAVEAAKKEIEDDDDEDDE